MAGKNIDFKNNITKRTKGQAVCNPTNIPSEFRSEFMKISIAVCNIPTIKKSKPPNLRPISVTVLCFYICAL